MPRQRLGQGVLCIEKGNLPGQEQLVFLAGGRAAACCFPGYFYKVGTWKIV